MGVGWAHQGCASGPWGVPRCVFLFLPKPLTSSAHTPRLPLPALLRTHLHGCPNHSPPLCTPHGCPCLAPCTLWQWLNLECPSSEGTWGWVGGGSWEGRGEHSVCRNRGGQILGSWQRRVAEKLQGGQSVPCPLICDEGTPWCLQPAAAQSQALKRSQKNHGVPFLRGPRPRFRHGSGQAHTLGPLSEQGHRALL